MESGALVGKTFSSKAGKVPNAVKGIEIPLDDELFRCEGYISILDVSIVAAAALSRSTQDAAEVAVVYQTLSSAFGDDVFARFREHVRVNRTPDDVIYDILAYLNECVHANIEAYTERPTQPPSGSSGGDSGTGEPTSRRVSLSKGKDTVRVIEEGDPVPQDRAAVQNARAKARTAHSG